MFEFSKKFLFYSLIIISTISFINISFLYWFKIQIPLSSYSIVSLMFASLSLKIYNLIPFVFLICIFMFFAAFSFLKERIISPIILFIFSLCDLSFLSISFFDSWFNDKNFILLQGTQIVIGITILIFMLIYFFFVKKLGENNQEKFL